jgi:flagellar hook assembly protein FlgD
VINADARSYSYRLTILNRNGAVVADIVKNIDDNPLDKSWNGRLKNGNLGQEEVYTYHLSVAFEGGEQQIMTGTVVVVYSD